MGRSTTNRYQVHVLRRGLHPSLQNVGWLWPFHQWLTTGDLIRSNYCDVQHRIIRLDANLVGLSTLIRSPRGRPVMGWWWIPMVVSWTMPISYSPTCISYADPCGWNATRSVENPILGSSRRHVKLVFLALPPPPRRHNKQMMMK